MRKTITALPIAAAIILFAANAHARTSDGIMTVNDYLDPTFSETTRMAMFAGAYAGVRYMLRDMPGSICYPAASTFNQIYAMFNKFVIDKPEYRHNALPEVIFQVLLDAWMCPVEKMVPRSEWPAQSTPKLGKK